MNGLIFLYLIACSNSLLQMPTDSSKGNGFNEGDCSAAPLLCCHDPEERSRFSTPDCSSALSWARAVALTLSPDSPLGPA